jgi:glycosyltransferase involved in cell wall biosynthesis
MSISGGMAQIYELAFMIAARMRGMRLFLHHHSFAYLDKPTLLARMLIRVARENAVHVTQSPVMAERLRYCYGAVRVVPISNAVFFPHGQIDSITRDRPKVVGFLSNIAPEKGVFEFLELMASADRAGLLVCGKLAGPFQDAATERAVRAQLATLPRVQYVGPQYGAAKDAFYAGIDILVFPTRYENETEGIVNHEAMCRGIPVIAFGRGCIPEIVGPDCGLVIDPAAPFVPAALAQLERWVADPAAFQAASKAASARFANTLAENQVRWRVLLAEIVGSDGALPGAEDATS